MSALLANVLRLHNAESNIERLHTEAQRIVAPAAVDAIQTARDVVRDLQPLIHEGRLAIEDVVDELADALASRGIGHRDAEAVVRRAIAQRLSPGLMGALTVMRPSDCVLTDPRPYVVKGLLSERDVACVFGPPGAGKSLIGPALCYAVAQGRPFFGHRTRQCETLYVAAEDAHGMQKRVGALRQRHGDAPQFGLLGGISDLLTAGSPDLESLLKHVRLALPGVIVIDTLAMAFPGLEENDAAAMGQVVTAARLLTETGAAVILIHHDTKSGTGTPRGHSILNGALDMAMKLDAKDKDGVVRGKLTKNRNGSVDADIAFHIAVENFGMDSDGDPITAAVMAEIVGCPPAAERMTPTEQAALDVLVDMLRLSQVSVSETAWRAECDSRRVSQAENPKSRSDVFNRAYKGLLAKRRVAARDGNVYLINDVATGFIADSDATAAIVARQSRQSQNANRCVSGDNGDRSLRSVAQSPNSDARNVKMKELME